jgi:type II secretory pathway component PulC
MASMAFADYGPREHARMLVRAWGDSGSVERVQSSGTSALGSNVQAGSIPRALLRAELDRGVGRFLQHVRVQAAVSRGHFVGWKLVSLFAKRPDVHVQVLQAGDILLRVNGASLERPEDFKAVWDSLAEAKEIVLDIERDGQPSSLHYAISG